MTAPPGLVGWPVADNLPGLREPDPWLPRVRSAHSDLALATSHNPHRDGVRQRFPLVKLRMTRASTSSLVHQHVTIFYNDAAFEESVSISSVGRHCINTTVGCNNCLNLIQIVVTTDTVAQFTARRELKMNSGKSNPHEFARILIVEDDEMQAQILQYGLTAAGFRVDSVAGGLEAVRMVEDGQYAAVLIDYNIPEIDGLATARLLGDILGPVARPVLIALTATPERVVARENGERSAFDLVLDKSCDVLSIISAITRCLDAAPAGAIKQAARDLLYDQAEEDYVMGPARTGAPGDAPGPIRILVVEDDVSQRRLLSKLLEKRGYIVETTSDGLEAIRRIRQNACDLAIVDYGLPEIDGLAVGALVHDQMAQACRPRLIALTVTPELLHGRAEANGPIFDQIVDKSSGFDELIASVDQVLRCSPNPDTRRAAAQMSSAGAGRVAAAG